MAKSKHAGRGEGSVYQRKSDGRWVASFIAEETGKRHYIYREKRSEAVEALRDALQEQKQGTLATGPRQTLKTYLEQWFEDVHKPTLRMGSYVKYRKLLNKHIIPALGHIQVQKLTPQQIQAFYARLSREKLSASMILSIHGLLHKALDNAVVWRLISRNVCDAVSLPQSSKREVQVLTNEQALRLLEVARGHRLEALLTIALITGMRHGELRGLRWQDINVDDMSLHIRRTVSYFPGQGYVEGEPKTSKSRRKILLPPFAIDMLKVHRTHQEEQRLKVGMAWQNNDLVFCNTTGGFLHPGHTLEKFRQLLQEAGLPRLRMHDLGHGAATIMLSMGVHPKVVQELLGHSQISMTMDTYSHALPSMQREAMNKVNELFQPPN